MIRPHSSAFRLALPLDGWTGRADPDGTGEAAGWFAGFEGAAPVAVPGSWNSQFAADGLGHYQGAFWYQCSFEMPRWNGVARLHIGGVNHAARLWLDGRRLGDSGAPMLPFEIDLPEAPVAGRRHRLVMRVDNRLGAGWETPGIAPADYVAEGRPKDAYLPAVRFDFLPHGGLCGPVHLCLLPPERLEDVRVRTSVEGDEGRVAVTIAAAGVARVRAAIGGAIVEGAPGETLLLEPAGCRLWSPADPALHDLVVEALGTDGRPCDRVVAPVGLRDIRPEGRRLLLNGRPLFLKGFGRHDEMGALGRPVPAAGLVRDAACLGWIGANSVRNAHYPHSEAWLDLCDRRGILVISEVFSVNLDFRRVTPATLDRHKAAAAALIARDGNHPCVIAWSLANEPGYLGEADYAGSGPYWAELFAHARALDPTRPLLHANVQHAGLDDPAFRHADILGINRYHGWYGVPGEPDRAVAALNADLDALAAAHDKPILLTEFGADALAGAHGFGANLFTEEYQAELLEAYWRALVAHPAVVGGHVWAFADFATAEHSRRAAGNRKGVFTADRTPKLAAHRLKALWA